jgi:hypothetical protein
MTALGIALWALAALWLVWLFLSSAHARPYPRYGYLGLAVIAVAEVLLFQGRPFVSMFFTPIAWTGYIAAVDAAVYSLAGQSMLRNRAPQFLAVTAMSAPFWLVFEAYNLRLHNWVYVNLPANTALRYAGYAWAFSTIWPAMLETADFLRAAGLWQRPCRPVRIGPRLRRALMAAGAAMLAMPLLAPARLAPYLFGLVWVGFVFLLDPLNSRLGAPSLTGDLASGCRGRFYALLLAGAIAGIFWEFWNYWALTKWIYIFPMLQNAKIFEMPVPGYLGFPPFALEYFCMYVFVVAIVQRAIGIRGINHYVADF